MEDISRRQAIAGAPPPPAGVSPNFVNPPSNAKYNVLCQAVCIPVITVFVVLRLYTRVFIHRKITGDDCKLSDLILRQLADVKRRLHSGLGRPSMAHLLKLPEKAN